MTIGLFGGSFDPPHLGHLLLAERCREAAGLDSVWFVPAYRPPHKLDRPMTKFEQRAEMVELAIAGHGAFRVERIERELPPPSYTVETLKALAERQPGDTFDLIVGGDSLVDFPTWHTPHEIARRARLIAVARPGVPAITPAELDAKLKVPAGTVRLTVVESPLVEISSRDLRDRSTRGLSIRYAVPRAVEEYVREKAIYRNRET